MCSPRTSRRPPLPTLQALLHVQVAQHPRTWHHTNYPITPPKKQIRPLQHAQPTCWCLLCRLQCCSCQRQQRPLTSSNPQPSSVLRTLRAPRPPVQPQMLSHAHQRSPLSPVVRCQPWHTERGCLPWHIDRVSVHADLQLATKPRVAAHTRPRNLPQVACRPLRAQRHTDLQLATKPRVAAHTPPLHADQQLARHADKRHSGQQLAKKPRVAAHTPPLTVPRVASCTPPHTLPRVATQPPRALPHADLQLARHANTGHADQQLVIPSHTCPPKPQLRPAHWHWYYSPRVGGHPLALSQEHSLRCALLLQGLLLCMLRASMHAPMQMPHVHAPPTALPPASTQTLAAPSQRSGAPWRRPRTQPPRLHPHRGRSLPASTPGVLPPHTVRHVATLAAWCSPSCATAGR